MTFTDVLALIALSVLGLIFWAAVAGMTANAEKMRDALNRPTPKGLARLQTVIITWIAVVMTFVPWLLMLVSVAQRVIA